MKKTPTKALTPPEKLAEEIYEALEAGVIVRNGVFITLDRIQDTECWSWVVRHGELQAHIDDEPLEEAADDYASALKAGFDAAFAYLDLLAAPPVPEEPRQEAELSDEPVAINGWQWPSDKVIAEVYNELGSFLHAYSMARVAYGRGVAVCLEQRPPVRRFLISYMAGFTQEILAMARDGWFPPDLRIILENGRLMTAAAIRLAHLGIPTTTDTAFIELGKGR